jgi:hypothetical protein
VTLSVQVDWAKNGSYTDTGDDVTTRVRPVTAAVSGGYGRDQSTALTPISAGRGSLTLDNTDRALSPRNTASPYYGRLKPARPVRIRRTVGASTYTLLLAHTDTTPINPDVEAKSVALTLVDSLADFRGVTVSTPLYSGIRTGTAIGRILDAAGWTGGRDVDQGGSVLPWWWEEGTDALTAMQNILAAEGPPALLTVGSAGEIVFRDRHHRLVRPSSTTSQGTWRGDGAVEPCFGRPFVYDEAWQNVVNTADISVPIRKHQAQQVVWSSTDIIDLSAGELVKIKATSTDPFLNAVTPVFGTDITVASGSATVIASLDRTSGGGVTVSLIAPGASRITALQLRAEPVQLIRTLGYTASDASSVADYGPRAHPDIPFAGLYDVRAIVQATLAQRAQPLPVITVTFQVGGTSASQQARAAAILARDLGDRVTVVEPETQLSADFYIESIAHELTGDENHTVTFGLEACPTQVANVFILGSATRGILGTNRLGKQGLDDPANVFILGSATNGVLGANLLGH